MNAIIPKRLRRGDTVGIVSPSDPVTPDTKEQLERGISSLKSLGFDIELAPNVLSTTLGYSATAKEKAADINRMFGASHIKAIICAQGGHNSISVLPYIDYQLIEENPKIFMGISDITVLLNAIHAKVGLTTFHGNDVMWGFGRDFSDYEREEFLGRLLDGQAGLIKKHKQWKCIREGSVQGKLVGGNLACLAKLAGTEYFPNVEGAVLFLEYYGETQPETVVSSAFHQLKLNGVFEKIRGLWLGYYKCPSNTPIERIAEEITGDYDFPILQCDAFGHNTPNTVIPIGVLAKMDTTNCNVQLLEPSVT